MPFPLSSQLSQLLFIVSSTIPSFVQAVNYINPLEVSYV